MAGWVVFPCTAVNPCGFEPSWHCGLHTRFSLTSFIKLGFRSVWGAHSFVAHAAAVM
jgi:hypothetical protein